MDNTAPESLLERAFTALNEGQPEQTYALCQQVIAVAPDQVDAWHLQAVALLGMGRHEEALASFAPVLAALPGNPEILSNQSCAFQALGRYADALAVCDQALSVQPSHAAALYNRGLALESLERRAEAVDSFDRAIALVPDYTQAHAHRAACSLRLERFEAAVESCDEGLKAWPQNAELWWIRGAAMRWLGDREEALACFKQALATAGDHPEAFSGATICALALCDWRTLGELIERFQKSDPASLPYPGLAFVYSNDAAVHLQCGASYVAAMKPSWPKPGPARARVARDKIRIAYLSADFRIHPVGFLFAELLSRHDRSRFEICGVSFGTDEQSAIRASLIEGFDQFHDVENMTDAQAAQLVANLDVDIAVDLMGHTHQARLGILAARPAPVQAGFLGFPGSTGADFLDYIIADPVVLPFDEQRFYSETIVHLPGCYLPGAAKRKISTKPISRLDAGLPEKGFVFCCFNAAWKITPEVFGRWMRLLKAVDGSVLWLSSSEADANLKRYTTEHGVDPGRLVFKQRLPFDEHLAVHGLADLFLDTLPYNAHATAADALWSGLPVLTLKGDTFAGRVAASILESVGLPELVSTDPAAFEALALGLAREPHRLTKIRQSLVARRETLFDPHAYVRGLEAVYQTMSQAWLKGQAPHNFAASPG